MKLQVSQVADRLSFVPSIVDGIKADGRRWIRSNKALIRREALAAGVLIDAAIRADLIEYHSSGLSLVVSATPPDSPVECDVIVPFYSGDRHYLGDALTGINSQRHAIVTAHLIADGCDVPELPELAAHVTVRLYQTPGNWGPYRITNSIVAGGNLASDIIALSDVDDIMLPDRLWRQIVTMRNISAEMISSAMEQFVDDEFSHDETMNKRAQNRPILFPGSVYTTVPLGHSINSTRTMTRELFERMNGFAEERCSMDFDFCNRCRHTGVKVIDDPTILSRRRIHGRSLTNGEFAEGSEHRRRTKERIYANLEKLTREPTIAIAQTCGALNSAISLTGSIVTASGGG